MGSGTATSQAALATVRGTDGKSKICRASDRRSRVILFAPKKKAASLFSILAALV